MDRFSYANVFNDKRMPVPRMPVPRMPVPRIVCDVDHMEHGSQTAF